MTKPRLASKSRAETVVPDVDALARAFTAEAVKALRSIVVDPKAPREIRVSAAITLAERGLLKPWPQAKPFARVSTQLSTDAKAEPVQGHLASSPQGGAMTITLSSARAART